MDMSNWPDETDHSEQTRERERLQEDIQEAFDRMLDDAVSYGHLRNHEGLTTEADIKLLRWALGVK
jgi:hypothetical protein